MPTGIYKRTKKHCENMGEANKGKVAWNKGLTKETDGRLLKAGKKISRSRKGMKLSKEHCENLSKKLLGHKVSKTTREKIRKALKDKKLSKEHRESISKSNKGRISCMKGKYHTKTTKKKLSIAATEQMIKTSQNWSKHYYQGSFFSNKNNKDVRYKSGFELGFYKALELLDYVVKYDVECLYIQYQLMGKTKHYIPDVLIHYKGGTKQLVEVKGIGEVNTKMNQAKFRAARKYCKKNNMEFRIWTEEGFFN